MKLCPPITPNKASEDSTNYNYNGFNQNSNSIFKHPIDKFISVSQQ